MNWLDWLFVMNDGRIEALSILGWGGVVAIVGGIAVVAFFTVTDPYWTKYSPVSTIGSAMFMGAVAGIVAVVLLLFPEILEWIGMLLLVILTISVGGWVVGKAITHL